MTSFGASHELFSLLNSGTPPRQQQPPPPPPDQADTVSLQSFHTPLPSTSNASPVSATPLPTSAPDFLAILSQSHPDQPQDGVRRPPSGRQSVIGGVIERPPPQSTAQQSASLLSLLQTLGQVAAQPAPPPPKAASPPATVPESPLGPHPAAANGQQAPTAATLLQQLMGAPRSLPPPPPSVSLPPIPAPSTTATSQTPDTELISAPPPPPPASTASPFAFVSPFDFLAQAHSAAVKQRQRNQTTTVPSSDAELNDHHALPPSISTPREPLEEPIQYANGEADERKDSPRSTQSSSETHKTRPSTPTKKPSSRDLLAHSFLPRSPASPSSLAGIRVDGTKPLIIDVGAKGEEERLYAASAGRGGVTAITIFSVPYEWGTGRAAGVWEKGFAYSTKHGRIRVIDRMSGAKLLLKGMAAAVRDLAIAPSPSVGGTKRMIASVGADSKLLVWSVPEGFSTNDPGYEKIVEIQGVPTASEARFQFVRFHPLFPSVPVLAVVLDDGKVVFVDLEASASGGEDVLWSGLGKVVHEGSLVVDLAFSPDGSAFVVLSSDGSFVLRDRASTSSSDPPILSSPPLPLITASGITFLAARNSRPTAVAISADRGTKIFLAPIFKAPGVLEPAVEFVFPNAAADEASFGHMEFHKESATLFVSQSVRGSLFAFRMAFDPRSYVSSDAVEWEDDAALLASFASPVGESNAPDAPVIENLVEIPTPENVINFVLDLSGPSGPSEAGTTALDNEVELLSAVCVHPMGVHQIAFEHLVPSATPFTSPSFEERDRMVSLGGGGPRRLSLEGSIHVETEVAVKVEKDDHHLDIPVIPEEPRTPLSPTYPATDDSQQVVADLAAPAPAGAKDVGELEKRVSTPPATSAGAPTPSPAPAPASTSAPAPPPALAATTPMSGSQRSGGKKGKKSADDKEKDRPIKIESPATSPSLDAVASAWATGNAKRNAAQATSKVDTGEVVKEVKRLQDSLPALVKKVVAEEMDRHAQRNEEDRQADRVADVARQETTLKLVSSTLSKSTSKLVEATLEKQIKSQVIPSIGKLVGAAVSDQISLGIAQALEKTLPNELERLLFRPDLTAHLARNFSAAVGPSLERSLLAVVAASVVPTIHQSVNTAIDTLMTTVRREMVDVRKEIVGEQSEALHRSEEEMEHLGDEVRDLKETVQRMEVLLKSFAAVPPAVAAGVVAPRSPRLSHEPRPPPPPLAPVQQRQPHHQKLPPNPPAQRRVEQPPVGLYEKPKALPSVPETQAYVQPPVPAQSQVVASYEPPTSPEPPHEDMFIRELQPTCGPDYKDLRFHLATYPPARLDVVFPAPPARTQLSQPIILSLILRLSELLKDEIGPLNREGETWLLWLHHGLNTIDARDSETKLFVYQIVNNVCDNLVSRGKALMGIADRRGADQVRTVANYAKGRLDSLPPPPAAAYR